MKLKSILITLMTLFIMFFASEVNASTGLPDEYIVNGNDVYKIKSTNYLPNSTISMNYTVDSNGNVVYCSEINDTAVREGSQKYTFNKEMNSKYAYVLANGYPNKSITGNKEKDYFITGLAVWYLVDSNDNVFRFFDLDKGTYRGIENDVAKELAKLIKGANNYSYTKTSISVNTNNVFSLSSDKKYYVSNAIGVSASNNISDYTVSLDNAPSGTVLVDANGNVKDTFGVKEKFTIKIPVSSIKELSNSFDVTVNAIGTIYKAYEYKPTEGKYQNTVALYPVSENVNGSMNVKFELSTKVIIGKIDAVTGNLLEGATLTVKDNNDKVIKTWVSGTSYEVIENLPVGKYILIEDKAPEGYKLSTEVIEFEVKLDGTVIELVMKNVPKDKTPIFISKKDSTTNEELAGAHLEVRDEKGNLIEAWVSDKTSHMIEGLKEGKYFLTEVLAPEGYELSTESVMFVVKSDGTVDGDIIIYNKPETIVEVPSTSSFKTITASLIGIIVIGLGSMIIYKNYKKNEEY